MLYLLVGPRLFQSRRSLYLPLTRSAPDSRSLSTIYLSVTEVHTDNIMNQVEIEVKISPNSDVVVVSLEDDRDASNHLALAQRMSREEFRFFEEKLRRKVDLRLMLMAWIMYVLNYFDRVSSPSLIWVDAADNLRLTERSCCRQDP